MISGILLAGGASRRFPPNKLAVELERDPLFWHALRALASVSTEVIVVIGHAGPEPSLPALAVPVRLARDRVADAGPLAGLAAGLDGCTGEWALVVAGDMPAVPAALLAAMRERTGVTGSAAIALLDEGKVRPLPCALRVAQARIAVPALLASGERRLRAIVEAPGADIAPEAWWRRSDAEGAWRRDVDRPEDLARERRSRPG